MEEKIIILAYHGCRGWDLNSEEKNSVFKILKEKFTGFHIVETFNSELLVKKLQKEGVEVKSTLDLLKEINAERMAEVYVQPMYLSEGQLWKECKKKLEEPGKKFQNFKILSPLFGEISDFSKIRSIIFEKYKSEDRGYLLLGHGGKDIGNAIYGMLGYLLNLEKENFYVATLEEGISLENNYQKMKKKIKKLEIIPLFMQRGTHFKRDIEEGIIPFFEKNGIRTEIAKEILPEYEGIGRFIAEKIQKSLEEK